MTAHVATATPAKRGHFHKGATSIQNLLAQAGEEADTSKYAFFVPSFAVAPDHHGAKSMSVERSLQWNKTMKSILSSPAIRVPGCARVSTHSAIGAAQLNQCCSPLPPWAACSLSLIRHSPKHRSHFKCFIPPQAAMTAVILLGPWSGKRRQFLWRDSRDFRKQRRCHIQPGQFESYAREM